MNTGQPAGPTSGGNPPSGIPQWLFGEPLLYTDQMTIAAIGQGPQHSRMTVLFGISFGSSLPPPQGQHVASVVMTPESAKALRDLLNQNLVACGMID